LKTALFACPRERQRARAKSVGRRSRRDRIELGVGSWIRPVLGRSETQGSVVALIPYPRGIPKHFSVVDSEQGKSWI